MQDQYDLWHAKNRVDLREVKKIKISASLDLDDLQSFLKIRSTPRALS